MDAEDQKSFVKELGNNVLEELLSDIENGKVPTEWDGIELRQLLSDRLKDAIRSSAMMPRRMRKYKNDVLENNL